VVTHPVNKTNTAKATLIFIVSEKKRELFFKAPKATYLKGSLWPISAVQCTAAADPKQTLTMF
jgi:hypothetical protein